MNNVLKISIAIFIVVGCALFVAGIIIGESFPKPLWIVAILGNIVSAAINLKNFRNSNKLWKKL